MSYVQIILGVLIITCITYFICILIKRAKPTNSLAIALSAGLTFGGALFFMGHTNSSNQKTDPLIVGIYAAFPPFTFVENEEFVGFEIDLAKEIGKRLYKEVEFKNMPFATLLPSLQLGSLHVVASGLTATPERAQVVLFSEPYVENNPLVILSLKSAPAKTLADLTHKPVLVNEGYTADLYMSNIPGPQLTRLKTVADAFLALKSGRASAFVTAKNTLKPFFDQYGSNEFYVSEIPHTDENTCMAVSPHYPELFKDIKATLATMKEDGSLEHLITKWGLGT